MKICPECLKQWEDEDVETCPDDGTTLRRFNDQALRIQGRVLDGRWRIEEKIGEGGMGEVYRAQQVSVDREVAVKVLRPAMAVSEEYVNRFFREANLASNINHPNFITIYDFGQAEDLQVLYLAMELLRGEDLAARMKRGTISLEHILQIGVQICSALVVAHRANIVHRDLKPENIFLVDVPAAGIHLKVLDFGIAKDIGRSQSMTRTGQLFGTPEYMSPEQCQSQGFVDGRSDLYSLGCILYELLTGVTPFHRDTIIQTLLAQVSDEPEPLEASGIAIPVDLVRIVHSLLDKDPDRRYARAEDVCDALAGVLEEVQSQPEMIEHFLESHRGTLEFDRLVDSQSETRSYHGDSDGRRQATLINLETFEHLTGSEVESGPEAEVPEKTSGALGTSVGWVGLGTVLAASVVFVLWYMPGEVVQPAGQPDEARVQLRATLNQSVDEAQREVELLATTDSARNAARDLSILATSMALTSENGRQSQPVERAEAVSRTRRPAQPRRDTSSKALLGFRTPTSIEKRVKGLQGGLIKCYGRRENIDDQGDVEIRFRITKDGDVDRFDVVDSSFDSPAMFTCLESEVKGWTFAPAKLGQGATYHQRTLTFEMN